MKKTINIFLIGILIFNALFLSVFAAQNAFVPEDSPIKSVNDVIRILNNIAKWFYVIFFIVAVIFIIIAAFNFLTAQAEPEKISIAKKQVIYAVIAIVIALLSISFKAIIETFLRTGS